MLHDLTRRIKDLEKKAQTAASLGGRGGDADGSTEGGLTPGVKMVSVKNTFRPFSERAKAFLGSAPWQHFLNRSALQGDGHREGQCVCVCVCVLGRDRESVCE